MFTVAFATPLPDARSVAGWIDGSDRPSCREAARAPPLCSLSPDLPDRENPAQILVGLVPQWPDVSCPYGRLRCVEVVIQDSELNLLRDPSFAGVLPDLWELFGKNLPSGHVTTVLG